MWKALKVAALACGLLVVHVPHAHAAWRLMFGNDSIPPDAISPYGLYTCRASFEGGMHPGWTAPGKNACAFGWGGVEQDSTEYELWVQDWEPATNGNIPANAIALGYEIYPGTSVPRARYACQAEDPAYLGWMPGSRIASGKVAPDIGGCDYPWGGAEQHATSYNVLVDSAITMVDSTGGPKLPVSLATLGAPPFLSTYELIYWSGQVLGDTTVVSGADDNGQSLYFCATAYNGGLQPGKITGGFPGCDISYGGKEIFTGNTYLQLYENWQIADHGNTNYCCGQIPIDQEIQAPSAQYPGGLWQSAVIGGHEADGSNLYLCLGWTSNESGWPYGYTPGKFSTALGTCSVAQNGKETLVAGGYRLLVETYTKPAL